MHIEVEVDDGVGRISFMRPEKRNAFTSKMWTGLTDALAQFAREPEIRVVVLTGSGGSFSAGADLTEVRSDSGTESAGYRALSVGGVTAVWDFPKPILAGIDGACIGAGCLVAAACDMRVATPRSFFSVPAVSYGLPVERASVERLAELMGPGAATAFLLAGERLDAREALNVRLVERLADDAEASALGWARAIASGDMEVSRLTLDYIRSRRAR